MDGIVPSRGFLKVGNLRWLMSTSTFKLGAESGKLSGPAGRWNSLLLRLHGKAQRALAAFNAVPMWRL